tara:strand:- start:485 stop:1192 length:708 start_codon:yes stop_codon:yes gene_type:complete
MKIYFDGCAKTGGYTLLPDVGKKYSKLLCEKLGAEEYNIAQRCGNNRRIVRNLLEHDLSEFDLFVIQMTKRRRFEFFDGNRWISIGYDEGRLPNRFTGLSGKNMVNFISRRDENNNVIKHTMWGDDIITSNERSEFTVNDVSEKLREMIKYLLFYFNNIYTEEQGKIDELMCYSTIKSTLRNHKHIIIWMGEGDCDVPVDLKYKKGEKYTSGLYFGSDKHQMIYYDVLEKYRCMS